MIDARFKLEFFDTVKVESEAQRAEIRGLSKMGAFVRRTAKSSIKTKKGSSQPGQPPHAHMTYETKAGKDRTGKSRVRFLFRDSILFGYDRPTGTLVVGPTFWMRGRTSPTMPEVQEKGGTATIKIGKGKTKSGRFPKRPYMQPALEKELPKFPGVFRGSIGG